MNKKLVACVVFVLLAVPACDMQIKPQYYATETPLSTETTLTPLPVYTVTTIELCVTAAAALNFRRTAGTQEPPILVLLTDQRVRVVGTDGKWRQVMYDNITGWVHSDYLGACQQ